MDTTLWTPGNIMLLTSGMTAVLTPAIVSIIVAIKANKKIDKVVDHVATVGEAIAGISDQNKDIDIKVNRVEAQSNGQLLRLENRLNQAEKSLELALSIISQSNPSLLSVIEATKLTRETEIPSVIVKP